MSLRLTGIDLLTVIAATWVGTFLVLLLPGRWIGRWIANTGANTLFGVLYCTAFSKLLIVILAVAAVFVRLPFLPHVNTDESFALAFMATLFFVPAFVAQFIGFRHARAEKSTSVAPN